MGKLGLSLLTAGIVLALSSCGSGEAPETPGKNQDDFADSIIASSDDEAINGENESSASKSTASFETNCIKIYCNEDDFTTPAEITDAATIREIIDAIDVSAWEKVDLENEISAVPAYYIDFCNGTALSMLADMGYGSVGTEFCAEYDENGNLSSFGLKNGGETYYYKDGLYEAVKNVLNEALCSDNGPSQQESLQAVTLQVQGESYRLIAEDTEKIAAILDVNSMTNVGDNGSSESFCPYEFVIGNTHYGLTDDLTRIEALGIQDNGEYSNYTKQTTAEERTILKTILSHYE